jgi:hypothetical protein
MTAAEFACGAVLMLAIVAGYAIVTTTSLVHAPLF